MWRYALPVVPGPPATLATPAPGSVLPGSSVLFGWPASRGATGYSLWLGSTGVGSANLYDSGTTTATSLTAKGLPTNGEIIYARINTIVNGVAQHVDSTYIAATEAALTTPAPGTVLTGPNVTFAWAAASGATDYSLWLGSTGVGSSNLYNSGTRTVTSITVDGLPTNGETIYARLGTTANGVTAYADYVYTATTQAALKSPAPGAVLAGSSARFTWSAASGASGYSLWLGSTGVGSSNLYNSHNTTATSVTATGLPTNGEIIYARINTSFNGVSAYTDTTYTAATLAQAALLSPAPGSTLTASRATFTSTAATGATSYSLWLGSTGVGSSNLYNSHSITATSVTATGLPTNGETIYARLNVITNGVAVHTDYTYTAAP